jgi:hypothetical protein
MTVGAFYMPENVTDSMGRIIQSGINTHLWVSKQDNSQTSQRMVNTVKMGITPQIAINLGITGKKPTLTGDYNPIPRL